MKAPPSTWEVRSPLRPNVLRAPTAKSLRQRSSSAKAVCAPAAVHRSEMRIGQAAGWDPLEPVSGSHITAEQLRAGFARHGRRHMFQCLQIVARVVWMRIVVGPEEAVAAVERRQCRNRMLVGIGGDPALAAKIVTRLVAQWRAAAQIGRGGCT